MLRAQAWRCDGTVARWRHRLALQTPQHNETIDVFYIKTDCSSSPQSVRSIFQIEFSTEYDLVLPLSIYSILSFPQGLPVAAYVFFIVFTSLLPFPLSFRQLGVLEGSYKWFHSLSIRTTMHTFLNEIRISANSCSYLPVSTSVRVPQKGTFGLDSNTRHVVIRNTVMFWRSTATSYKVSGAVWLRHMSGYVPNARTWRQLHMTQSFTPQ